MAISLQSAKPRDLKTISNPIRQALVTEAINFQNSDDLGNKAYSTLYTFDTYTIRVGKPGKETVQHKKHKNGSLVYNVNDMTPTVFENDTIVERDGSFEDIFRRFSQILPNTGVLELLACLCVRNAYTLDHVQQANGTWRYTPNTEVIHTINNGLPENFPEPIEVFLYYLEAIALNEDVKYTTLGYNIEDGTGRVNNLLTYANLIGVLLTRVDFIKFASNLTRPPVGVSPISIKKALEIFPQLRPIAQIQQD